MAGFTTMAVGRLLSPIWGLKHGYQSAAATLLDDVGRLLSPIWGLKPSLPSPVVVLAASEGS